MSKICLDVCSHVDPKYGGIVSSLPHFGAAMDAGGRYITHRAAFCRPGEEKSAPHLTCWPYAHGAWWRQPALQAQYGHRLSEASVVHIHGIWEAHCRVSAQAALRLNQPYLVSAHGMLDEWSLRQKALKKTLYLWLTERATLQRAACLRAVTRAELDNYRALGLTNPVAVIPNGISLPPRVTPELFLTRFPALRDRPLVLFLGRLHPKKGLFPLLQAWPDVGPHTGAHLVIAGPDDAGTEAALEQQIRARKLESSVTLTGILVGDEKWSAFAASSLFALPSYSEGFSVALLEALGTGTPALISPGCYFDEVAHVGAGWLTEVTPSAIAAALVHALHAGEEALKIAGHRALALAQQYTWERVATQMADVYDWVGGGSRPTSCAIDIP
ncbi:MAG: glycosyltransferase [Acidobacteria bacterium]|nr:glycosyltransferase [Acidobacteriota bacterium]